LHAQHQAAVVGTHSRAVDGGLGAGGHPRRASAVGSCASMVLFARRTQLLKRMGTSEQMNKAVELKPRELAWPPGPGELASVLGKLAPETAEATRTPPLPVQWVPAAAGGSDVSARAREARRPTRWSNAPNAAEPAVTAA